MFGLGGDDVKNIFSNFLYVKWKKWPFQSQYEGVLSLKWEIKCNIVKKDTNSKSMY